MLDFVGVGAGYMKVHWLIALLVGAVLDESRIASLDLNPTSSLLLNMLDVSTSVANYLRSQIKTLDGLEVDWDALLRPFTLFLRSELHTRR